MALRRLLLAGLFPALALLASCDQIDINKARENTVKEDPDTVSVAEAPVRRTILFDFTGQTCGNCPRGHRIAEGMADEYQDRFMIMSVHCGYYATPHLEYTDDFRTMTGNDLNLYYGADAAGLPRGVIDGAKGSLSNTSSWTTLVAQAQAKPNPASALSITLNGGKAKVNVTQTAAASHGLQLNIYILRDSITGKQLDYSAPDGQQNLNPYIHRHVLRDTALHIVNFVGKGFTGHKARTYLVNFPDVDKAWRNEVIATLADSTTGEIINSAHANQQVY